MAYSICAVVADSKSSDTVWFVRLYSNPKEGIASITDDYDHNQDNHTYVLHSMRSKKQPKMSIYKDSIIIHIYIINSVECPSNCIKIQNQELYDIITYIEHNWLHRVVAYVFSTIEVSSFFFFFFKFVFTPCKAEQPLQGIELQEKETQKD